MTTMRIPARAAALLAAAALSVPGPLAGQIVLERSPLLTGGWVGTPGSLEVTSAFRFGRDERREMDVLVLPSFRGGFGLPLRSLVGGEYAPHSPLAAGRVGEWEVFGRHQALSRDRGAPLDLSVQAGYNGGGAAASTARSALARWLGPVRLLGAARGFTDAYGEGERRAALAAGAVLYPLPRLLPVAVAADVAAPLGGGAGEGPGWSAAVLLGVSHTVNTLSLFATNTGSGTLQGSTRADGGTRFGLELTLPIPAGRILGRYRPRAEARRAVRPVETPPMDAVAASIARYDFVEKRIEVAAGTTVQWTNRDAVVHTVTADDRSWDSGAIAPGGRWSATFTEPGLYPFYCGPHPYMRGMVIVR
jgi:plastocyanin